MGFAKQEANQEAEEMTADTVETEKKPQIKLTAPEMRQLLDKAFEVMLAVAGGGANGSSAGEVLAGTLEDVFRKLVALEVELKTLESADNTKQ